LMTAHKELAGNTLRVYLYLVTHGPSELREVQRGLELSTPSLAFYHLSRLIEFGYVTQDGEGRYVAVREASVDILQEYSKVGSAMIPNLLFFSFLFTILVSFFGYMSLFSRGFTIYLVATSIAMVAVLWYETLRLWRKMVVEKTEDRS
jgi:predicted DNA-binding transcriptional regulator